MGQSKPSITRTTHTLPFDKLSPRDFERLCLWLVEREGYERPEHLGAAGSEQGRDIIAWHEGQMWAFQCKRVQRFGPSDSLTEVEKVLSLPEADRPARLVFLVTCDVSDKTRQQARARCAGEMACHFWASTELDEKVKQHPDILEEFFQDVRPSRPGELHDYLAQAVADYERRMYQLVARAAAPPAQPYKFLYAFEIEDAPIFFGRDVASEALYEKVMSNRITVLHARSGAGKTSLLRAGLSPRLIREGCLPVYARSYNDPVLAVKRAIASPSVGPWSELLSQLSLPEFLGLICTHLSHQTQELLIMLDQFEEFFISYPDREHRQKFVEALANCYEDNALPTRFIIALRSEYFADLSDFQGRLPTILHNNYRLEAMSRAGASLAITRPLIQVTYEPALLDTLLDDLARGGMELPHLQIICTRLYETLPPEQTIITLTSYDKMGRAEAILGSYLTDTLQHRFAGMQGMIAEEVLKELVSSEATKRVLNRESLRARVKEKAELAEIKEAELDEVLDRLVDARLLRRDEETGIIQYEMAHDYLAEQIKGWLDWEDVEVKRAEELLEREIANWRASGTLMSPDHLRVITDQSGRLRLPSEVQDFLLLSALARSYKVAHWWAQHPDPARATDLVTSFLLDDDRQRAWELADTLWPEGLPLDRALRPLTEQITNRSDSEDAQQRQRAREIQVFIGPFTRQTPRGHLQFLQTGFRLLVPDRWSAILTLALGGALGGFVCGLFFLSLIMVLWNRGLDLVLLLKNIAINGPALAIDAALIGIGLCLGTVLSRGRSLSLEVIGAACGGAIGGLSTTFYLLLFGSLMPTLGLLPTLFDLTLSSAILATTIVIGMRVAVKRNTRESRDWNRVIRQISSAVLAACLAGILRDILLNVFPGGTLVAISLGACLATGLSLAELSLTRNNQLRCVWSDAGKASD